MNHYLNLSVLSLTALLNLIILFKLWQPEPEKTNETLPPLPAVLTADSLDKLDGSPEDITQSRFTHTA
jgi:hypothetical protein